MVTYCYLNLMSKVIPFKNGLMVFTSVGLVASFFETIWVCIMRISHVFDTSRVRVFDSVYVFDIIQVYIHARTFITRYNHP